MIQYQYRQLAIGCAIIIGSIGAFFWWGVHFDLFGHKFNFAGKPIATFVFFGWVIAGMFGGGYLAGGSRGGIKAVGSFLVLIGGAFVFGWFVGNY